MKASVDIVYRYLTNPDTVRDAPVDGAAAQSRLEEGNRTFAALLAALETPEGIGRLQINVDARAVGLLADGAAPAQKPYAALLGCADARVPAELIFGEGPNDLFVVRVAGNVLGQDVLGSLRYAAQNLPLRAAVVLGHSGCGAVSSATDLFRAPSGLLDFATDHALRGLLNRLGLMVHAATRVLCAAHGDAAQHHPGWRLALIEMAIALNAASGAFMLQKDLAGLGGASISILHGVYVLDSRTVRAACAEAGERAGLAPPPANEAAFKATFTALALSPRIAGLLGG
ncbi:carbonic anhydrase [Humitalea sp. 24SJ18S-53]|uniref:carbonic anhydrase n=1 Tax=Humitalea sp. 24SJ18S-53 TaxID=3422307 RepID=UPI003D664B9B